MAKRKICQAMAVLFYAMYRLFGAMGECTGLSLEDAILKRDKK